ncbi:MAG: tagatose-6-phosphate kinase, phosphofructokinase i [Phycisphaerales bacterium]|nr:tagatose-6-phosphate kinase, phosphofructokinase i [Phycisphaerales bacterium]
MRISGQHDRDAHGTVKYNPDMILCLGTTPTVQRSMTFERFEVDAVNRSAQVQEYASGKSPNVARVLKALGADPLAVGFAGGDRGRFLLDDLKQAGIQSDFVTVAAATRLCTTIIDNATGTATELVEESLPIEPAAWDELDRRLRALLPKSRTWIFSGSLPPGAPQDFYARWLPLARDCGARLILDARGEPLRVAMRYPGFIAKLNRDELAATLDRPLDTPDALREATREITPEGGAAIVTMGAQGALASDGKHVWRLTPPKVKAVSAVGSGDAFAAGLAVGLLRGQPLPESLALASACGAANAMTALAGHLDPQNVERLVSDAVVRAI